MHPKSTATFFSMANNAQPGDQGAVLIDEANEYDLWGQL